MKTRDLSPYHAESKPLSLIKTLQGILTQGWGWYQSRQAQEELILALDEVLSDECLMLRDVTIPRVPKPIPLVLISPAGLTVINPKAVQGFFRAEGKRWETLGRNDEYQLASNNLIRETWLYEKTIEGYLKKHNFKAPTNRSALIFVNPETDIESIRPRVKVIRADGIINFARQLAVAKPVFTDIDFRNTVKLLSQPRLPKETSQKNPAAPVPQDTSPAVPKQVDESIEKISQAVNFNRREWIILISMAVLLIIVLIILITLVVMSG